MPDRIKPGDAPAPTSSLAQETIDAAGTVTRKLARWLVAKGYDPDAADRAG